MKSFLSALVLLFLPAFAAFSQNEKVLLTIGDEKVTVPEFERIYKKNNSANSSFKQTPEEYLDLFINFKLKVIEAENLGMDTVSSFIKELKGYRDQLVKPYINDSAIAEELCNQEYDRMRTELHISSLLIRVDPKGTPADTLKVYNQLMDIRKRALAGEDFQKLINQYSEDPAIKMNKGDIGWMTAFRTVWDFENAIYNTPVGSVSLPIRTQYGYHLAKVKESRPSKGTIQVYHIFVRAPEDMTPEQKLTAQNKIFAVYDSLKQGASFAEMVKNNSDDRSTVAKGGELPWFGAGQMIPEFENAAFSLSNIGDFTKPVQSFYGWHILKLKGRKELGSYSELREELLSKVYDPQMAVVRKTLYVNKLKKQYNYTFNKPAFDKFCSQVDSALFSGQWSDSLFRNNKEVLFGFENQKYTVADFAAYLYRIQKKSENYALMPYLTRQFDSYSTTALQDFEKNILPERYPEFKYILQEYHDGILLFDLTDKMVWSKAILDTTGLEKFYSQNKSQYMWGKRADALIFSGDSAELISAARDLAIKYGKKKDFGDKFVLDRICKGDSVKNCITITEALYEKGENADVDKTNWTIGAGEIFKIDSLNTFVYIRKTVEPEIKKLDEARGLVISDYQNFLEKAWIEELRAKYPVKVDYDLLKTIK